MQFVNYKDLLESDEILSFKNAEKAYQMILDAHPEKDVELKGYYQMLLKEQSVMHNIA